MPANPVFDEVLFPLGLSTGSTGGPVYKTSVIPASSGYEQRNAAWARGRLKWSLSKGLVKPSDRDVLVNFFRARQGRLRAFRFRDPFDNAASAQALTLATSTTAQLIKVYADAGNSETRIIKKPVAGTLALTRDAVAFPAAGNWAVDTTTGIITFNAAQTGHAIAATFQFDTPARFDQDEMALNLQDLYVEWPNITILEEFLP